jgi:peptidoglycan/LPS O-acetylase OafA/YrhL
MAAQIRLKNLQFLRFVAAFIVIFAHVELYEFVVSGVSQSMFGLGAIGVDIFLLSVVSSCVMYQRS